MNGDEAYSWPAYRLFIVNEMKRMADLLEKIDQRLRALELKAAKYGALAGLIGTGVFEVSKLIVLAVLRK